MEVEALDDACAVKLLVAADVTEEAVVETEDAACTTVDCTRDAKDPKNEPISDIPSDIEPDDGLELDAGFSEITSEGLDS